MADAMLAGWGEPITRRKGITARGYGESGDRRSSFWPMSAEHYRTVALRFRKRAADTSDLQLRQAIRYVAATYEAAKAKARGRGPFARPGQPALRPVQGEAGFRARYPRAQVPSMHQRSPGWPTAVNRRPRLLRPGPNRKSRSPFGEQRGGSVAVDLCSSAPAAPPRRRR